MGSKRPMVSESNKVNERKQELNNYLSEKIADKHECWIENILIRGICWIFFGFKALIFSHKQDFFLKTIFEILKNYSRQYGSVLMRIFDNIMEIPKNKMKSIKGGKKSDFFIKLIIIIFLVFFNRKHTVLRQIHFRNFQNAQCIHGGECVREVENYLLSYENQNIDITGCFFTRFYKFSVYSGVIYINGGSFFMNISYSMFHNCKNENKGGAIYFASENSTLKMISADSCFCHYGWYGHFAFISAKQISNIDFLSISRCSTTTQGFCSIYFQSGHQVFKNSNSTMNNAETFSGVRISSPISFLSSHSCFIKNNVSDSICVGFFSSSLTMSFTSFIENNSPSRLGVIYFNGDGSPIFMHCTFSHNHDSLFSNPYGSIEIAHCFIEHNFGISNGGTIITHNNNTIFNDLSLPTQYCFQSLSQSLFTEQTQLDSPLQSTNPSSTNKILDSNLLTASLINEQINNRADQSNSNSLFIYSTVILLIVVGIMIVRNYAVKTKEYSHSSTPGSNNPV